MKNFSLMKFSSKVLLLIFFFAIFDNTLGAPPYPGVWKRTRIGFKSQQGVMRISPESLISIKSEIKKKEGKIKCAVLLTEFQDKTFNIKINGQNIPPKNYFEEMIFGSSQTNQYYKYPTFKEFWLVNSNGKFMVEGEVFGPYKLPYKLSDYGCGFKNGSGRYCGFGNGTENLAKDLISTADKDVDFSKFDEDNDGIVDCFMIVHAGKGAETQEYTIDDSKCCDIWSHAFYTYIPTAEGVTISSGVVAAGISEIFPAGNMGLIAHEFGHLLGLPDLYDAGTGFQSCGVGPYSLMGYGLYKGDPPGTLPANLSPWEKIYLGWAFPEVVTDYFCEAISSTSKSGFFVKVPAYGDPNSKEYFLVEFRKKENFDVDFPSEGVLIWHIDENVINSKIGSNRVNEDECYPGCGNECGEIKDEQGNFITCKKHYGVKVVFPLRYNETTKTYSDIWRFEKTNIFENSINCLESQPNDFWEEGDIFPDSQTAAYGYEAKPHDVVIGIFWKEENRINIGATPKGINVSLRSPEISQAQRFDWVSPENKYRAEILVKGTPPIKLEILAPEGASFDSGEKSIRISKTQEGTANQKVYVVWKAPQEEQVSVFKIRAENCIDEYIKEWQVRVQKPDSTVSDFPQEEDGADGTLGCNCLSTHPNLPSAIANLAIIFAIVILYRKKLTTTPGKNALKKNTR